MKYTKLFLFLFTALAAVATGAYGQDGPPPEDGPHDERPDARRPNLLAELGLSREQIQQIRRFNQERRPAMMQAQRRMVDANRALDAAIYRDSPSGEEFQAGLKEVQTAQSELARLRFESELAVRRILTSEQLVRFRELRQRFAEEREGEMRNRRRRGDGPGTSPMRDGPQRRPPLND